MTQEPDEREGRKPPAATSVTVTIGTGFWRNFFKWAAGVALVFTLGFLLLFLNAAQLTGRDVAHKGLTRALASITEVDAVLADGRADLKAKAEESPDEDLRLADYPIDVPLTSQQAQQLSTAELRELLLSRSADKVYAEGVSAFREEGRGPSTHDIAILSAPGAVRYTVGLLTEDTHDAMWMTTVALTGITAFLALLLALLSRGYGRLTSVGIATLIASLPFLLFFVTVRFILRLASESEGDYLTAQLYALGKDVAWLPIRTGIAFAVLGVVFVVMGVGFSLLEGRRLSRG
ncbi:MAG: hypothetical protein MUP86_00665 [Dehalococcoidia bacterium]|nr:hypothetical protein [Dehalococcoidia bacterium]